MRARKTCSNPYCSKLQPCEDHPKKAWATSKRSDKTKLSGSKQQKRARQVIFKHNSICHICGYPGADQADHVQPLSEGGPDTSENMRPIHADPCHREKTQAEALRARPSAE